MLVMISPLSIDEDASHSAFNESEIREIRRMYKYSGLYKNDGSTKPIWTIEYWNSSHTAYLLPDAKHLAIGHDYGFWGGSSRVVTFYVDGYEIRTYEVGDLISCFHAKGLINRLVGREFFSCDGKSFDADAGTYTVGTNQCELFTFDITNGKLVHHQSPWAFIVTVPLVLVPVVFVIVRRIGLPRLEVAAESKGSRRQITLMQLVVAIAILSAGLAVVRISFVLFVLCSATALTGAGIAWICARHRRAFLTGAVFSLYGASLGFASWALIDDFLVSYADIYDSDRSLLTLGATGIIAGALFAGLFERKCLS